ncbi:hypothetical protein [Leyella stercorea]|uniref:hypothetical protein n=1 Tax=Leyella stercorea TaxID=363265 RepID=UPI00242DBE54|nr:hypothetical protein [Leyella stercorea]
MVGWGIRVDRCGCLRRPLRMSASTDADGKICGGGGEKGAWEVWEVCEGCVEGCVGMAGMPYPPMGVLCR